MKYSTPRFITGATYVTALSTALALVLSGCTPATAPESSSTDASPASESSVSAPSNQIDEATPTPLPAIPLTPCEADKAIRVIVARGTDETLDSGLLNPTAAEIQAVAPQHIQVTQLEYPADWQFETSTPAGVDGLVTMLNSQATDCPDQHTVLLGFSQGALVVSDALSSPSLRQYPDSGATVVDQAGARIAAIGLVGNPRFVGAAPYNAGTYDPALNGEFAPGDASALEPYASRIVDVCAARDFVCQKGGDIEAHLSYYTDDTAHQLAAFVIEKIRTYVPAGA